MNNHLIAHSTAGEADPADTLGIEVLPKIASDQAHPAKYTVSVRTLCEFTAKQGDLDLRFTPSPSAQEGIAGHGIVTSRRPRHYQTEVSLSGEF
ncbi:MAG: hypothetical protein ABIO50_01190 [Nitrosospira sp.]